MQAPEAFLHWERFTGWLFDHTVHWPKSVRATLTVRIENLTLDVFERIVEARYDIDRTTALRQASVAVEKIRLLLRLAHARKHLDPMAFAHACAELDTAGRMLGGWRKHASGTP